MLKNGGLSGSGILVVTSGGPGTLGGGLGATLGGGGPTSLRASGGEGGNTCLPKGSFRWLLDETMKILGLFGDS